MSVPGPYQTPPDSPKSNLTWLWIVLGVLAVLLLVCGGLCAGCTFMVQRTATEGVKAIAKFAEVALVQGIALGSIEQDETVTERLGSVTGDDNPEVVGGYVPGAPSMTVRFKLNGEKEDATATAIAARKDGSLTVTDIEVKFADGTVIDVKPLELGSEELNYPVEVQEAMPADEPADNP